MHERREQHHPDQGRVDQDRERQTEAEHPHERHLRGDQRGKRDRHDYRCRRDDAAGARDAQRDALVAAHRRLSVNQNSRMRETRKTS